MRTLRCRLNEDIPDLMPEESPVSVPPLSPTGNLQVARRLKSAGMAQRFARLCPRPPPLPAFQQLPPPAEHSSEHVE